MTGRMLPVAHEASCDSFSWNVQVFCLGPNAFVEFVLFDTPEGAKIRTCSWCDSSDFQFSRTSYGCPTHTHHSLSRSFCSSVSLVGNLKIKISQWR